MPDDGPPVTAENMIRSELGVILDELGRLPGDAFADRSRLQARQAELRRLLRDLGHPEIVSPLHM